MRKISKVLAIVLAFVMVLCPVLTAAAETEVLYSSAILNAEIADGKANVTLTVETIEEINAIDFKINLAKGVSFDPEVDTVSINADESGDAAAWNVTAVCADGVLSVLAIDGDDMANVAAYLVFDITLTVENTSDYEFYLTKIFAVGAGSADTDEVIAVFPCADNAQSGVIDVEAARVDCPDYFVTNVCAHASTTTNETPATCTEDGSSVVVCDDCGTVVSSTPLPATGHNFVVEGEIIAATEEAVGYFGYDIACDVCDALNPAYYAEDGSVRTDVDFAALAAEGLLEEIPMLEKPCDTATEYSKDETGHWFDCTCGEKHDFAAHIAGDAKEENRVEAAPGVAGSYDTVVYCSVCNYEISRTSNEIPALPVGPKVDDTLVVAGAAVGFGISSLQVNFRIRKTVIQKYAKVELVIIPQKYDTITYNLADPVEIVPALTAAGNFYTFAYGDIYLYELGLNIDYMLRAYDANGDVVAVSPTYTTSAASYLKTSYATSTDAKFRTLAVDTLVVGAKAVEGTAANYADSDLAKATSIIEGFDISEATPSVETYNTVDEFNSYNSKFTTATSATHRVMKSVTIGKAPYIGFRIKDQKSALDMSKISYKVSYTKNEGVGKEVPYEKTFNSTNTTIAKAGQFITFSFAEIGIQDGNKDIAIEIYYDGEKVCDMTYSIETYLGANLTSTVGELAAAIIKLGASYRAYAS